MRLMLADCKSADLCLQKFESFLFHQIKRQPKNSRYSLENQVFFQSSKVWCTGKALFYKFSNLKKYKLFVIDKTWLSLLINIRIHWMSCRVRNKRSFDMILIVHKLNLSKKVLVELPYNFDSDVQSFCLLEFRKL